MKMPGTGLRLLLPAVLAAAPLRAVEPIPLAESPVEGPGVQVLFMGTNLAILKDREFHPVLGIDDGAYLIGRRGRETRVPLSDREVRFKVDPTLKLSPVSVRVENLRTARGYTPAKDPRRRRLADAGGAAGTAAAIDLATDNLVGAATAQQNAFIPSSAPPEAVGALGAQTARANDALASVSAQYTSAGEQADLLAGDLAEERFDAVEVDFAISSPAPLAAPYLVVLTRYRHPGTARGAERNMVHAQELEAVDEKPRRVVIRQGGFPPGYELAEVQVHVYDGGREVASNVAPKRVPLAREEAWQYLMIEHLSAFGGQTVPARPAIGHLPAAQRAQLSAEALERTYFVKVAKDGRPTASGEDEACRKPVGDPVVAAVLAEMLFLPALEKGRPVAGVAKVRLAEVP